MFKRKSFFRLALVALLMSATQAFATNLNTNMTVGITTTSECLLTTSPLAFGSLPALITTAINVSTTLSFGCSNGTPYTVAMDAGTTTGATTAARLMTSGSGTLGYGLYQNSGHTTPWDNSSNVYSGTGGGTVSAHTVYGQITAGQAATPGSYTDTITITVSY